LEVPRVYSDFRSESIGEQTLQWLALGLTPGLGPTRVRHRVEHFGGVAAIFRASLTELEATGLMAVSAQALGTGRSLELAHEEVGKAAAAGAKIVTLADSDYPQRPKQIYDPPLLLYVRGDAKILSQRGIAVVGTRHPTPYASGMAAKGKTVAVFGTGVDVLYPKETPVWRNKFWRSAER